MCSVTYFTLFWGVAFRSITFNDLPYNLSKPVRALYVDHERSLWVGTKGEGLLRIPNFYDRKTFDAAHVEQKTTANSDLLDNSVYTFAEEEQPCLRIGEVGPVAVFDGIQAVGVSVGHYVTRVGCILHQSAVGAQPEVALAVVEDAVHGVGDARKGYRDMEKESYRRGELYISRIIDEEMKKDDLRI